MRGVDSTCRQSTSTTVWLFVVEKEVALRVRPAFVPWPHLTCSVTLRISLFLLELVFWAVKWGHYCPQGSAGDKWDKTASLQGLAVRGPGMASLGERTGSQKGTEDSGRLGALRGVVGSFSQDCGKAPSSWYLRPEPGHTLGCRGPWRPSWRRGPAAGPSPPLPHPSQREEPSDTGGPVGSSRWSLGRRSGTSVRSQESIRPSVPGPELLHFREFHCLARVPPELAKHPTCTLAQTLELRALAREGTAEDAGGEGEWVGSTGTAPFSPGSRGPRALPAASSSFFFF